MAIRGVRDLGGFGQLADTILRKRALDEQAKDKELTRRIAEGQLAAQEAATIKAGQRSDLERSLAGSFAGATPTDGVGPPIPGEIIGERGAATISESPVGTLADLESFLKLSDPTRGQKVSAFQRGQGAIVDVDGVKKFVTPVFDPTGGGQTLAVTDIPGTITSREGETPADKEARRVREAGDKAQATADVKLATEPGIKAAVTRAELEEKIKLEPDLEKKKALQRDAAQAAEKNILQLAKTEQNIRNYDNAIKAVQSGAKTGTLTRLFPSFRESSILLDQMQAELGLDVVGSVTFGALSKGELDLAKEVALPTNLDGPELVQWIEKKRDVQIKMANILREASIFLSQPGTTQADWLQKNGAATISREQGNATPAQAPTGGAIQIPGMPEGFTIERVQ